MVQAVVLKRVVARSLEVDSAGTVVVDPIRHECVRVGVVQQRKAAVDVVVHIVVSIYEEHRVYDFHLPYLMSLRF